VRRWWLHAEPRADDLDEIMADYVFDGDLIRLQTVRFTLEPVS